MGDHGSFDAMRLAAFVLRPTDALEGVRRFVAAEELGYDAAYATHVNGHDAPTLMGAACVRTERIEIGVGVVPIYTRTPATMAMAAATLWELSQGRAMLGLGSGHRLVMQRWHGDPMARPISEMREYVAIVRGILAGRPLAQADKWASDMPLVGVSPAPTMPLMVGALAPAMLQLAGEIGDGVMVWLGTPGYFADVVVPNVQIGRERAGKTMEGFQIVASIPCAATDDVESARQSYVKQIAHNLRLPFYRGLLERAGYEADLSYVQQVDRYEDLEHPVLGDALEGLANGPLVSDIAAIGDDDALGAKLAAYRDAGVTTAGVNPIRLDRYDDTLAGVARAMNRNRP